MTRRDDNSAYMREYRRRPDAAQKAREKREARRQLLHDAKNVPCAMCEESFHPVCMDFHHRDPETKLFPIASRAGTVGLQALLDEIDKCDVLCSNCHRLLEYDVLVTNKENNATHC